MPAKLPLHVTNQVKTLLEDPNETAASIGVKVGLSKRTIERMRLNFELFGEPYTPSFSKQGRPRTLTAEQESWLLAYLDDRPTAYHDELALAVEDRFGVVVKPRTVCNVLLAHGCTREVCRARAAQMSDHPRAKRSGRSRPEGASQSHGEPHQA